jgi:PRTRC genetic system protein C
MKQAKKNKSINQKKTEVMLLATQLERVFILKDKGQDIKLTDPEPRWSVEAVMNFYANMYPILTTAKVSAPQIKDDAVEYKFESVMGTKG